MALSTALLSPAALAAQERSPAVLLANALENRDIRRALAALAVAENTTVQTLTALASIPSPSRREHERARWVAERMRAIGLQQVTVDTLPNVVGILPGLSGRALVFMSILDDLATIEKLQEAAHRPPYRDGHRVIGPATEVQSATAALLTAAESLVKAGFQPEHDLVFVALAQEEVGMAGMKYFYPRWRDRAIAFIDVLGDGARIVYAAGSTALWRIGASGPAGRHGLPSTSHGMARAMDRIFALSGRTDGRDPDWTLNIGVVRAGEVTNYKPETGWFSLDVRSRNADVIRSVERDVRKVLDEVSRETSISFEMVELSFSLGGQIPGARESRLVRVAEEISRHLGHKPEVSEQGCCHMRIAVGQGSAAMGVHGERGGDRALPGEWADIPAMMRAAQFVVLLAATLGASDQPE